MTMPGPIGGYIVFSSGRCLLWAILAVLTVSWMRWGSNSHPQPLSAGGLMGSHGRSIRLRIYFLVAIPLITMLGLFGYVAYTSVTSWLNLDRAPSLIRDTSEPLAKFVNILQAERRAAVVYLSQPTAAN